MNPLVVVSITPQLNGSDDDAGDESEETNEEEQREAQPSKVAPTQWTL